MQMTDLQNVQSDLINLGERSIGKSIVLYFILLLE